MGVHYSSSGYYTVDSSNNTLSSPYKGAVGVKQADKGYYVVDSSGTATNSGGVRQDACPVGRYADADGTTECTSCGSQETTADSGSTSSTDCVCVAGYYLSGGSCTQCGVGSYKSAIGDGGCTTASSGYYTVDSSNNALSSPYKGAVGVKQADKGYYVVDSSGTATNSGGVRQDACPVGRYADADGTTECTSCGSQETTADSGSTSSTDCVCVAGYYLSGGSCTQCGVGSYKSAIGDGGALQLHRATTLLTAAIIHFLVLTKVLWVSSKQTKGIT